ncbi:MAG TPA: tetratricopeptide repeat protein [Micromonosporaceae bacterium]
MRYTERQLWDLLESSQAMPYGSAQIAAVERVIAGAESSDDLLFAAKMFATTAYMYGGEPAKSFVTFTWCRSTYDQDPDRYAGHTRTLLWQFKYLAGTMRKFPDVPLRRTADLLDDMERRWVAHGYGLQAVYAYRHVLAAHIGDQAAAADWFRQWDAAPRNELSDCDGCDATNKVAWLVSQRRDEEAIALAEPVLAARTSCVEQPQQLLTVLLPAYVRTGRLAEARSAHLRAYRALRGNVADLESIAEHVFFCGITGNEERGRILVERHLAWRDTSPTPYATMRFAAAASMVLTRLEPDVTLHRPGFEDRPPGDPAARAFAIELAALAIELAERFDDQAGSSSTEPGSPAQQSRLVAKVLGAEPLCDYLPLDDAPPVVAVPAEIPAAATADELLDLADGYLLREDSVNVGAVEDAFDERFARAELTPLQRGRRADIRGLVAANAGDIGVAEIAWTSALDLFAAARDDVRRHASRARLGLLMCQTGRNEIGLPIVMDSTDYLVSSGPVGRHCSAYQRLAFAYLMSGRVDDALESLDHAASVASISEDPLVACKLPAHRAGILADAGRLDEAKETATDAREICRAAGYRTGVASMSWILGRIAQEHGDLEQALEAYDEALASADQPRFAREVRRQRASMLGGTSQAADVIDDLAEEVEAASAAGESDIARTARYHLATAYLNAGRPLDAADELEDLLAGFVPGDLAIESVRHMLAQAYRRLDQSDQAIEQLELIASAAAERGFSPLVGEMNEQIAQILDVLDRDAPAATRFDVACDAYVAAEMPLEAVRTGRRSATSQMWAHRMDDAISALAKVDMIALDFTAAEPEARWERAMLGVDGARILAANEDLDAAIIRCGPAITAFVALDDSGAAAFARATYGEFLLRADRAVEAEPVLRAALDDGDENVRRRAAQGLVRALRSLGRADEADQVGGAP